MVRITLRFPLGVYHARSATSSTDEAEWPPSPLRLVGALLAAAHGGASKGADEDRDLLQRLCDAPPPVVVAPKSVPAGQRATEDEVTRLRGATRWAPRNYVTGPISPRDLGRARAPVSKAGVALGDRSVAFVWPELELSPQEVVRLEHLATEVTFVGTSRSPTLVEVDTPDEEDSDETAWLPVDRGAAPRSGTVSVRVPDDSTIATFDRREDARRSSSDQVENAGMVPGIPIGREVPYTYGPGAEDSVFDPEWWGEMVVLPIDQGRSEVMPKAAATYLLTRAFRVALLGAYDEPDSPGEAPPILRARGAEPHCAVIPLPAVWGPNGDGRVLGVAVVLPHRHRVPDVDEQRRRVEDGLTALLADAGGKPQRYLKIPGAGRVWLTQLDSSSIRLTTLRPEPYSAASRVWTSVTPIVHSHWRKRGADALLRQVTTDCAHVGLPEPEVIEIMRGPGRDGGASRLVEARHLPRAWRSLIDGPADHLRITFDRPVRGPVLLGKARHFGVGLCVPGDA